MNFLRLQNGNTLGLQQGGSLLLQSSPDEEEEDQADESNVLTAENAEPLIGWYVPAPRWRPEPVEEPPKPVEPPAVTHRGSATFEATAGMFADGVAIPGAWRVVKSELLDEADRLEKQFKADGGPCELVLMVVELRAMADEIDADTKISGDKKPPA